MDVAEALERMLAPPMAGLQPPQLELPPAQLHAAISSLALGGAERIVMAWATRGAALHRVSIVVLRDATNEWVPPVGVEVVRLHGRDVLSRLEEEGRRMAASGTAMLCHLLTAAERAALARGGTQPVPVLHNARDGWLEPARALMHAPRVVTVSRAAAAELRDCGVRATATVLRFLPPAPRAQPDARAAWRERWAIPVDATVIGMVGAVKPQKAYTRALRVLAELPDSVHLVIIGGPTGRDGLLAWHAVLAQARRLGVSPRVRLPGYVADASRCLSAFDLFLNTSRYEGLSIATLEALAARLPVVASRVGGQGEISAPGLTLLAFDAADSDWAGAVREVLARMAPAAPAWVGFPAERVWTLCHLAHEFAPGRGVLFVTANLNAGGAQRSLVNLALALHDRLHMEIAVCGNSSSSAFSQVLSAAGVAHFRSAASRDCMDHAEALVRHIMAQQPAAVCFWNADPKLKLLLAKTLAFTRLRFVDVSPGAYAFEEMRATRPFQECIAFSEEEYYARLDRLVLKYIAAPPEGARTCATVIANGVKIPRRVRQGARRTARIVVSGRIAPSKYLVEIVEAMREVWLSFPYAQLHVLGRAEVRHADYARLFLRYLDAELGRRVFVHGAAFDAPERIAEYDIALVLGENQGCPNAVLEAMAAGVPVVANDSGGTRELIVDGRTGLLLPDREPRSVARALARLLSDQALADRLARAGLAQVKRRFSMTRMARDYERLFKGLRGGHASS